MSHGEVGSHPVVIAPALAEDLDVALILEISEDASDGAFGDPDKIRKLGDADIGLPGKCEQDVSVVGQEPP